MNIGRKPLNDAEFNSLWALLYQEFHTLAMTNRCNASLVYNTIYTVCTSSVPYEDRLYWRIGDFLYSRCRDHRATIQDSEDRIKAYSHVFGRYETLVRAINRLGCFLNECITARKLDDFGYLLWERCVIQDMPSTFFIEVFSHPSPTRIAAVRSFSLIVPDPNDPLLYYRERYEKPALEIIRQRYIMVQRIEDLLLFSKTVHSIVLRERDHFDEYFLPDSFPAHEQVLSECLFGTHKDILISGLKNLISYENSTRLESLKLTENKNTQNFNDKTQLLIDEEISEILKPIIERRNAYSPEFVSKKEAITSIRENNSDSSRTNNRENYSDSSRTNIRDIPVDSSLTNQRNSQMDPSTRTNQRNSQTNPQNYRDSQMNPPNTNDENSKCSTSSSDSIHSTNPIFDLVYKQLSVLDTGFSILKSAYSFYVIDIINAYHPFLSNSIFDIFNLFNALNIFNISDDQNCKYSDFHDILTVTFKYVLLRVKPCFITRLCMFTDNLVGDTFVKISSKKSLMINTVSGSLKGTGSDDVKASGGDLNALGNDVKLSGSNLKDSGNDLKLSGGDIQTSINNINSINNVKMAEKPVFGEHDTSENNCKDNNINNIPQEITLFQSTGSVDISDTITQHNRTNALCQENKDTSIISKKPFEGPVSLNQILIFKEIAKLVTDKREFVNIYLSVLKDRLLNRNTNLNSELKLLELLGIIDDDRANVMIEDINRSTRRLKILNASYWNLEAHNSEVNIPEQLLGELRSELLEIQNNNSDIFTIREKGKLKRAFNEKVKFSSAKNIKYAHQFSTVVVKINENTLKMNIYQYAIVDALCCNSMDFMELINKTNIKENVLKEAIYPLVEMKVIIKKDGLFALNCESSISGDISEIKSTERKEFDICIDTYFLALAASVLKRLKSLKKEELFGELKKLSIIEFKEEYAFKLLKSIIDKGLGEFRDDWIDYVF